MSKEKKSENKEDFSFYNSSSEGSSENDDLLDDEFVKEYMDEDLLPPDEEDVEVYHMSDDVSQFQTRDLIQRIKDLEHELQRTKGISQGVSRSIKDNQKMKDLEFKEFEDEEDYDEDILLSERHEDFDRLLEQEDEEGLYSFDSEFGDLPGTCGVFEEKEIDELESILTLKRRPEPIAKHRNRRPAPVLPSVFFDDDDTDSDDVSDEDFDNPSYQEGRARGGPPQNGRGRQSSSTSQESSSPMYGSSSYYRQLYSQYSSNNNGIRNKNGEHPTKFETLQMRLRESRDQFRNIKGFRRTLQLHRDLILSLRDVQRRQLKNKELDYLNLQDKMYAVSHDLTQSRKEVKELRAKVSEMEKRNQFLYTNYTKMKDENSRIKSERDEEVNSTKTELIKAKKSLLDLRDMKYKKLVEIQHDCLREFITKQKDDRRRMMKTIESMKKERYEFINQLEMLKKEIGDMTHKETKLEKSLDHLYRNDELKQYDELNQKLNEELFETLRKNLLSEELLDNPKLKNNDLSMKKSKQQHNSKKKQGNQKNVGNQKRKKKKKKRRKNL